jgi:hypothetical protein
LDIEEGSRKESGFIMSFSVSILVRSSSLLVSLVRLGELGNKFTKHKEKDFE